MRSVHKHKVVTHEIVLLWLECIFTFSGNKGTINIETLLADYEALNTVSIDDIIQFHYTFERIHPFQDGNGRVGRLIALKECLRFGIVPFIIEDSKKFYYYRGLSEWENEKGYLTGTCLDGQDTFKRLMESFDIRL